MISKAGIKSEEYIISVKKPDGTPRMQWQENWLGKFLRTYIMEIKIPYLTGRKTDKVVIKINYK